MRRPHVDRHRAFQITITACLVVSCGLVVLAPQYAAHSTVGSTLASLLWLWE